MKTMLVKGVAALVLFVALCTAAIVLHLTGSSTKLLTIAPDERTDLTQPGFFYTYLHGTDSKLFGEDVLTGYDGNLLRISSDGNDLQLYDVKVNWLSVLSDERLVIYGNTDCDVGILRFDEDNQLVSNHIIASSEHLLIDPTITKVGDTYYATMTEIEGNVNNAKLTVDNGYYAVHLYRSDAPEESWDYVTDITWGYSNIEDPDLWYDDDRLYFTFERENVDKGNSEIRLLTSTSPDGSTWDDSVVLLPADCDHEPAGITLTDDGFRLYYSADFAHPGTSYDGASCYCADYDRDGYCLDRDIPIETVSGTTDGMLLFDVRQTDGMLLLLYAYRYFSDNSLVLERGWVTAPHAERVSAAETAAYAQR